MSTDAQHKRFKKLDSEWKSDMMSRKSDELKKVLIDVAIANVVLDLAKAADPDLASLKEQLKTANAGYSEGRKSNNTKTEFLVECLRSQGIDIPDVSAFCAALKDELEVGGDGP